MIMNSIIEFLDARSTADRYLIDVVGDYAMGGRALFEGYVPPAAAQAFRKKVGKKGSYEFSPAGPNRVFIDANAPSWALEFLVQAVRGEIAHSAKGRAQSEDLTKGTHEVIPWPEQRLRRRFGG